MALRNREKPTRLATAGTILAKLLAGVLATASLCIGQSSPQLQITSPDSGTVVNPGQTITVTVASPAGTAFSQLLVIGQEPIGFSSVATTPSLPMQFSLTIPTNIACGTYTLVASGTTQSGPNAQSDPVSIDVERADIPRVLSTLHQSLTLEHVGDTAPFNVVAMFSDGSVLKVTRSSYMTYTSANTSVATVDANGIITAVAPGATLITATYTLGSNSQQLPLMVKVAYPLVALPSALGFETLDVGTTSSPRSTTLTNVSNSAISVTGVSATGDFSTQANTCVSMSPLASQASCSITVTFTPTAAGARTGTISIQDSSNPSSLTVPLFGTGQSDFSLSVTPATQSVSLRGSAKYTVSASSIGGFNGTIALSVSGVPASTTASFNPTSISNGSGVSTLTVATSSKTPLGSFTLTVTGTSGSLAHSASVTLSVTK